MPDIERLNTSPNTSGSVYFSVNSAIEAAEVRREDFKGTEHLVVPMVILTEQVIHPSNAPQPELALASEFGRFPEGWNGRPVVLNHPQRDGIHVSASHPDVLENDTFGFLLNTTLDDKKLKTEAWINLSIVENLGDEVLTTINSIEEGTVAEVSTGLFTVLENTSGEFNGEEFSGIWRNVVPDHLAILSEGTIGACSVEDGCGAPRANSDSNCSCGNSDCGGKCMTLKDAEDSEADTDTESDAQPNIFQKVLEKFRDTIGFVANGHEMGDADVREALRAALESANPDDYHWIANVFSDDFVYETSGLLYKRDYSISESGEVTLGDAIEQVRPVIDYVSVNNQENLMANEAKVNKLISNESTKFTEDQKDWLMTLSDEQLEILEPVDQVATADDPSDDDADVSSESVQDEANQSSQENVLEANSAAKPKTLAEFLEDAPAELKETLTSGVKLHQGRKQEIVKSLLANSRNKFSEEALVGKSLDELESLASLANIPQYDGLSGPRDNSASNDTVIEMPRTFDYGRSAESA